VQFKLDDRDPVACRGCVQADANAGVVVKGTSQVSKGALGKLLGGMHPDEVAFRLRKRAVSASRPKVVQ
jgi:hypothetical protein